MGISGFSSGASDRSPAAESKMFRLKMAPGSRLRCDQAVATALLDGAGLASGSVLSTLAARRAVAPCAQKNAHNASVVSRSTFLNRLFAAAAMNTKA